MSFCYLLNAVLLFTGVVAFIIAGFAGTFSRRLHGCRYRLMLAPLGFVVLGSLSHSITASLVLWLTHGTAFAHPGLIGNLGSTAEMFESCVLVLAGVAGALAGVALGSTLDRVPASEQTYTIANYWKRRRAVAGIAVASASPSRGDNVIAISENRRHSATLHPIKSAAKND